MPRSVFIFLIATPLIGCPGGDLYDFDGDGSPDSEDCEPQDADVFPGALELCDDTVDNDCDGLVSDTTHLAQFDPTQFTR